MAKRSTGKRATRAKARKRAAMCRKPGASCTDFLKSAHTAVRSHLAAASDLPTFLNSKTELSIEGRRRLVEQALLLLEQNFVHLRLKEAMHGVNPIQKLRLIKHRLDRATKETMSPESQFHREMIEVFTSVRDLHTNYLLPAPFADKVAFMPFSIEEYFDKDKTKTPHYIVTHFVEGFSHAHFKQGVEIVMWNGAPIRRAIEISADQHGGSNLAARHARGVDGLTLRALQRALPPDTNWVTIGYIDNDGVEREMRQDWLVAPMLSDKDGVDPDSATVDAASLGMDIEADIKQRARKMLFAPDAVAEEKNSKEPAGARSAAAGQELETAMSGVFKARSVATRSGKFGYIRIFTFHVENPDAFIDEFVRLAGLLPQTGLIVDVRGNGGGHIRAAEGLLQVLTPREITPEPTQFINTPLNGQICNRHKENPLGIDLEPWVASITAAIETGAIYSRGFPITPHDFANSRGQKYHGPVVLITDARCYSATDIFAAGFKDHEIGDILGVDSNTGAGGANVWTHGLLKDLLDRPDPKDPRTPYRDLPNGAGMCVAIRRTLRVGAEAGTPVEDLGVMPDAQHAMTKGDLLEDNKDLIAKAGRILKGKTKNMRSVPRLSVTTGQADSKLIVRATIAGFSRLDAYIDLRPAESLDLDDDGDHVFELDLPAGAAQLLLEGYEDGMLVAARKVIL